jgi:putrescine transport system permease protein
VVRLGVKPEIYAVCTIMIAVVALAVIAASLAGRRRAGAVSSKQEG